MTDADDDPEYPVWLANSAHAYGFGYTKEQALIWMAANAPEAKRDVEVQLVEHTGDASVSPSGFRVDTFVSGERVTIDAERFNALRDEATHITVMAESAIEDADREEIETVGEDE